MSWVVPLSRSLPLCCSFDLFNIFVRARRRNRSGTEDQIYPRATDPFIVSFRVYLWWFLSLLISRLSSSMYTHFQFAMQKDKPRSSNNMCNNNNRNRKRKKRGEKSGATHDFTDGEIFSLSLFHLLISFHFVWSILIFLLLLVIVVVQKAVESIQKSIFT